MLVLLHSSSTTILSVHKRFIESSILLLVMDLVNYFFLEIGVNM